MGHASPITGAGPGRVAGTVGISDRTKVGSAMAVHFSQPSSVPDPAGGGMTPNAAVWTIEVYVQFGEGEYLLGTLVTTPPSAGARPARVVGIAYCPGATQWRVALLGPVGATCQVHLSTDDCCYGGTFGLVEVEDAEVLASTWTPPNAVAVQGTLSAGPTTLEKVYGLLEAATPAATFFGLVDKAAAVVNGDPFLVAPFPVPDLWPRSFSFGADPRGLRFASQARWALSSTAGVVTLVGAGGAIVSAERVP